MTDALANEYGWSMEYILGLPVDVTAQLIHALLHRKGVKTHRRVLVRDESAGDLASRLDSIFRQVDTKE